MMKVRPCVMAGAVVLGMVAGSAVAQPRVAIVASASNTFNAQNDPRFTDPRDKLMGTGLFSEVAIFSTTPFQQGASLTLADLTPYDAVLTWSDQSHEDSFALGDLLAEYVDQGGGVVVAVFNNTSAHIDRYLEGRWQNGGPGGGYIAVPQNGGFVQGTWAGIGTRYQPSHPIFEGVEEFWTGIGAGPPPFGGFRPSQTGLTPGSVRLADWTDGKTLVALAPNPRVVELGFQPVSNAVSPGYWDQTTDGARLIANALLWAGREFSECRPDLTAGAVPGTPGYGTPNGFLNNDDFFYYLSQYGAGNLAVADLTTGAVPGTPGYGVPNGVVNTDDFFYYLTIFSAGC